LPTNSGSTCKLILTSEGTGEEVSVFVIMQERLVAAWYLRKETKHMIAQCTNFINSILEGLV
jgi:hypothetical protein